MYDRPMATVLAAMQNDVGSMVSTFVKFDLNSKLPLEHFSFLFTFVGVVAMSNRTKENRLLHTII